MLSEEFLYYIWQFKKWDKEIPLFSIDNQPIQVVSPGVRNNDSGPDFFNAKVKIGNILLVGNVEIHLKTSDWFLHKHDQDKNYENIILHVVYENDISDKIGNFETLELKKYIDKSLIDKFSTIQKPFEFIPCEHFISKVEPFYRQAFLERLFIDRLQQKSEYLNQRLQILKGDWEALLFEEISYVFGLKINAEPFRSLAKSFEFNILRQNKNNAEALIFGQAGFLENPEDEYMQSLKNEYDFIKYKHQLNSIENHLFKFLRLRPANFPTLRLAQLASIYKTENKLFSSLIKCRDLKDYYKLFESFKTSEYWQNHYRFGKETKTKISNSISKKLTDSVLLNAWYPILFLYKQSQIDFEVEEFLNFYLKLPAEKNTVIDGFKRLGIKIKNAFQTQAYLELKKNFCNPKKCLHCGIGNQILKNVR
ncbi:DUF2851 family protein [Weeksellaceae bacterium TAE3-ERU29]|nr:DUF2851 family protein [Weeksellaceae bacterium TAE3-ERU29]